ncbi:MAG TPA: MerR family transcriptional regulator [Blastocatellia bacterium]|nr:MerR family transcriptional regulator [Blastocatellia bacterium]
MLFPSYRGLTIKKVLDPGIDTRVYNRLVSKSSEDNWLLAGELAALTGVSTDTLRHYERKGVLAKPARSAGGYRRYSSEAVGRVRLVRRVLAVGFTLDELARIFEVRDKGGAPCHQVRELAATKLSDIEVRLKELLSMRDELRAIIKDWDKQLLNLPAGKQGRLLETLSSEKRSSRTVHRKANLKPNHKRKSAI